MAGVNAIATGAAKNSAETNMFSRGGWSDNELIGQTVCTGKDGYRTDTDPSSAQSLNLYVSNSSRINVYDPKQKDLIGRYEKLITDPIITSVSMVSRNEKVDDLISVYNPKGDLIGENANGATKTYVYEDNTISHINVYLARDPMKWGDDTKVNFDGSRTTTTKTELRDKSYIGVVAYHEIAGHAFLRLTKPNMDEGVHNRAVEDFQRSIQKFFKVGNFYPFKHSDVIPHTH